MKKISLLAIIFIIIFTLFFSTNTVSAATCASLGGVCEDDCVGQEKENSSDDCKAPKKCCVIPCASLKGKCEATCTDGRKDAGSPYGCSTKCCIDESTTPAGSGPKTGTVDLAGSSPVEITDIPTIIGNFIKAILGFVGAVALFMFVYGGVLMLTSAGNQEKVKKGKDTLIWSIIGLAVIFGSFFLVDAVLTGFQGSGPGFGAAPQGNGGSSTTSCYDQSGYTCIKSDDKCSNPTYGSMTDASGFSCDEAGPNLKCCKPDAGPIKDQK
jgi:type IV secretion system pilin